MAARKDRKDEIEKVQRNFLFTESCHAEERDISDFNKYEMLRLTFITF